MNTAVLFALAGALGVSAFRPFWVVEHSPLVATRLDPVVAPGIVSAHVHAFAGGSNLSPVVDFEHSEKATCTTSGTDLDKSNYWAPQLYRRTGNGDEVIMQPHDYTTTYYEAVREPGEAMYEFPPGFRMTGGQASRSTPYDESDPAYKAISFSCLDFSKEGTPYEPAFPQRKCPNGLRLQVGYPNCWDGVHNWLEGSKHVTYPTGGWEHQGPCPASHPKRLVRIFAEYVFHDDYDYVPGARVLATGDTTGYSAHGDFANGWPEGLFSEIFAQGEKCDVFFELNKCPALASSFTNRKDCSYTGATADEAVGDRDGTKLPKLPGNNPFYGAEGSGRDKGYKESVALKGAQARDAKESAILASVIRKSYVLGDPDFPAGNEVTYPSGGGANFNEKAPEPAPAPTPSPSPAVVPLPDPVADDAAQDAPATDAQSGAAPAGGAQSTASSPPAQSPAPVPSPDPTPSPDPAPAPQPAPAESTASRGYGASGGWRGRGGWGRNRAVVGVEVPGKACNANKRSAERPVRRSRSVRT